MINQIKKKYIYQLYDGEIDVNKPYSIKRDKLNIDDISTFTLNDIKYDKYIDDERLDIINKSLYNLHQNNKITCDVWSEVYIKIKKDLPNIYKKRCGGYTILIDENEFIRKYEEVEQRFIIEFVDVNNNKITSTFIMRDNSLIEGNKTIEMI